MKSHDTSDMWCLQGPHLFLCLSNDWSDRNLKSFTSCSLQSSSVFNDMWTAADQIRLNVHPFSPCDWLPRPDWFHLCLFLVYLSQCRLCGACSVCEQIQGLCGTTDYVFWWRSLEWSLEWTFRVLSAAVKHFLIQDQLKQSVMWLTNQHKTPTFTSSQHWSHFIPEFQTVRKTQSDIQRCSLRVVDYLFSFLKQDRWKGFWV